MKKLSIRPKITWDYFNPWWTLGKYALEELNKKLSQFCSGDRSEFNATRIRAPRDRSSAFRNDRISPRFRKRDTGGEILKPSAPMIESREYAEKLALENLTTRGVSGRHFARLLCISCTANVPTRGEREAMWEKPVHFAETRFRSTALSLSSDPEDTRRPSSRSALCVAFTVSRHPRLGKSHGWLSIFATIQDVYERSI